MDTWEYLTMTFRTDDPSMTVPLHDDVPREHDYPKYSPYKLIPQLNDYGRKGWELISLDPVQEGRNGDVRYADASGAVWTYTYLAVFKRRIPA